MPNNGTGTLLMYVIKGNSKLLLLYECMPSKILPASAPPSLQTDFSSRKRLRTKATPELHLSYSKNNGGNLGVVLNDKKRKFLHKMICCDNLLESLRGGDSNRLSQHMNLRRTNDNYANILLESGLL